MSVILDALKKLDREKSSRRNGTTNIAVEILRPDLPRPGKRIPVYITTVSLTAIAATAITYAVMLEFGFLSKSSPPTPVNLPAPSQQVASVPLSSEPASDARDGISRVPPKIQNHAESKNAPTSLSEKKESQNVISEETGVATGNTKKTVEHTLKGSTTTPPSLKLSAIVWYEEPSKRVAMINGMITHEGSVIEGVEVVEIYPNRVRLLQNGRHFEITMFK
jgi:general secretion pathway protein B